MNKLGDGLPVQVKQCIDTFVEAAKSAFEADLAAIVLFGSAAEGQLRTTSDVNMLLALKRFDQAHADRLREPMRIAHAAIELNVMFLLETEIAAAAEAFAVKFADIQSRHRVLYGTDPFQHLETPRSALIQRLKQVLLNLQIRLRERYVLISLREEQLAHVIADAAAPLRSSAASLLQLEGHEVLPPKRALEKIGEESGHPRFSEALKQVSVAREQTQLAHGKATPILFTLIELVQIMRDRVDRLR